MSTTKRLLLVFSILALGLLFYLAKRKPIAQPALAPDFELPQLNGEPLRLSSYRGKVVLLDFWATWCGPCLEEIPRFIELQNKLGPRGLQIIGVSMDDSPDPVRDFYRKHKMNYPVVMGNAKLGEQYGGILGLPIAFVIGSDGSVYRKHIGATDVSILEKEITDLLSNQSTQIEIQPSRISPRDAVATIAHNNTP